MQPIQQTATLDNATITYQNIAGLEVMVASANPCMFRFLLQFRTAAATTGLGLVFSAPAMSAAGWSASIRSAANGTDAFFESTQSALTTEIVSPGVPAQDTDYLAVVEGFFIPSARGTVRLRARSEVAGSNVRVTNGLGLLWV